MSKISNGGPAFPVDVPGHRIEMGMTMRDYFAANAPQPPADFLRLEIEYSDTAAWYVRWSWFYADAMLRARGEA